MPGQVVMLGTGAIGEFVSIDLNRARFGIVVKLPEGTGPIRADPDDVVPVLVEDGTDPVVDAMLNLTLAGFTLEPADPSERKRS